MRVLTCNIRCFGANDGENSWAYRKELCADVIRSRSADIICFQEMWRQQFADLARSLPGYQSYGMVDEPTGRNPQNCIFYRPEACALISSGGYWLSETPHVTGSASWQSACVRLANWVRLEDRSSGTEFRVINTHLDHVSQAARENQARLVVQDAQAYPDDYPQILTGDMNCDCTNAAIEVCKAGGWLDTYGAIHGTENPGHTYHAFLGPEYRGAIGKMDWILVRGSFRAVAAHVITESRQGRFPSDHYFVSADVILTNGAATSSAR
ncbi:endonuclease/exonuclease/phosphatase family protein [bacterium]|nr:endonuclease/exonuclease/phosphatase family protein [bacterium]